MRDEEYIFHQDCREKKAAGRGIYSRKGGSKSKRCRLPSDNLTEAQKRKLNGEVITVKLYSEIAWSDFKKANKQVQKLYILAWQETFEARQNDIAEMFGISQNGFNQWCKKHVPEIKWPRKRKISPKWEEYLEKRKTGGICIGEPAEAMPDDTELPMVEPDIPKLPEEEIIPTREEAKKVNLRVEDGHIRMTGNAEAIFTKMLLMFDSKKNYEITVVFVEVDKYAE